MSEVHPTGGEQSPLGAAGSAEPGPPESPLAAASVDPEIPLDHDFKDLSYVLALIQFYR